MPTPGNDARGLAAALARRADHRSVTADRLAGTADAVADLRRPVVAHLADGERPQFLFDADAKGVGVGGPEATVPPERGGVFAFTDRRALVLLGVGADDRALSLPYRSLAAATYHRGIRRHRVELATAESSYHLWIPADFEREGVERAVAYAAARSGRATPDADGGEADAAELRRVRERLERLGDAYSRGLADAEAVERRSEGLTDG